MADALYTNPGSAFLNDAGAVDETFGTAVATCPPSDVPTHLAHRLGFDVVHGGPKPYLSQALPIRAHIVLEYFYEGASVGRQQGMNALQVGRLLATLDSVLRCALAPAVGGDTTFGAAVSTWEAALEAHGAHPDALGEVAGTGEAGSHAWSATMRVKLDAWMRETGPLLARHWAMLARAVAAPDSRARVPVQARLPVELPLPMPSLAGAQQVVA